MLTTHPHLTTDSFTLYIKATLLLGKAKAFNGRFKLRHAAGDGNVAFDQSQPLAEGNDDSRPMKDPRETDDFKALDYLIESFSAHIPNGLNDAIGLRTGAKLDPTLYMAHMIPHV